MILESAQLLCSAHARGAAPYKPTHLEHPCSLWTRRSLGNYRYLIRHAQALVQEFADRGTEHASGEVIAWCAANEPQLQLNGVTRQHREATTAGRIADREGVILLAERLADALT